MVIYGMWNCGNLSERRNKRNMDDCIKGFYIPAEAWYKNIVTGNPEIWIGFYSKEGRTAGEFEIEWDGIGIRLHVYNGSWEALSEMPELIALMAKYDREQIEPDIKEFAEQLKKIGFKDVTERERAEESGGGKKKVRSVLKEARKKAGMTQQEVADQIGICHTYYAKIEAGKRTGDFYIWDKLEDIFGIHQRKLREE